MAFNINAQVILSGPKNIQKVKSTIQSQLQGINVGININLNRGLNSSLNNLNKSLNNVANTLTRISSVATQSSSSLNSVAQASSYIHQHTNKAAASISHTNKSLHQTAKTAKSAGYSMREFGREAANAVRRFGAFTIATGAIYGFIRSIQTATSEAISFDREMVKLKQVTDASGSELDKVKKTIDDLAVSLGLNANQLAQVATTLAQAGLSANDTASALKAVAKAALTPSFGNLKDTTEGVIAVMAQFGIAANKMEEVLGSINAVAKAFAVESEDLISVIRRAGGVFAIAGGQMREPQEALAELLGIFTAVRSTTRESADTIATGLRTIFSRLQRKTTIEFLKQFNIDLLDSEGKFVGFYESFKRISQGLQGLFNKGDTVTIAAIVEELGGIRQVGKLIPAIVNFTKAEEARKIALQGTASITKDVETATQSLSVQIQQLQQRFEKLVRDITQSTSFQTLAKFALQTANAFITVADTLKPLLPLIITLAGIKLSKSLADFSVGFIGGFSKGGGAAGVGAAAGGAISGSTTSANQQATQQLTQAITQHTQAINTNIQSVNNNTGAVNNLITELTTLINNFAPINTAISTASTTISNLLGGLNNVNVSIGNLINAIKTIPLPASPTAPVKFARGGVVPGTGNRDTVPAMLTPGEFVIKKSSVKKLGTDTLSAMNENKYGSGGGILKERTVGMAVGDIISEGPNYDVIKGTAEVDFSKKGQEGPLNKKTGFGELNSKSIADIFQARGSSAKNISTDDIQVGKIPEGDLLNITSEYAGAMTIPYNTISEGITKDDSDSFNKILDEELKIAIANGAKKWANSVGVKLSDEDLTFADNFKLPAGFKGAYFESVVDAFQGRPIGQEASESKRPFDFTSGIKKIGTLFNVLSDSGIKYIDAKISGGENISKAEYTKKIINQIADDLINDPGYISKINNRNQELKTKLNETKAKRKNSGLNKTKAERKNSGGSISGTDTVPALLTPGEFVVNKGAAQKIGYSNLNRMNKTGVSHFAKGGMVGVQKFAGGTGLQGAMPPNVGSFYKSAPSSGMALDVRGANNELKSLQDVISDLKQQFLKAKGTSAQFAVIEDNIVSILSSEADELMQSLTLWQKIKQKLKIEYSNSIDFSFEQINGYIRSATSNVISLNSNLQATNDSGEEIKFNLSSLGQSFMNAENYANLLAENTAKAAIAAKATPKNPIGISTGSMKLPDFGALEKKAAEIANIPGDTRSNFSRLSKALNDAGVEMEDIKAAENTFKLVLQNGGNQLAAMLESIKKVKDNMTLLSSAAGSATTTLTTIPTISKSIPTGPIANTNIPTATGTKSTPTATAPAIPSAPATASTPTAPISPPPPPPAIDDLNKAIIAAGEKIRTLGDKSQDIDEKMKILQKSLDPFAPKFEDLLKAVEVYKSSIETSGSDSEALDAAFKSMKESIRTYEEKLASTAPPTGATPSTTTPPGANVNPNTTTAPATADSATKSADDIQTAASALQENFKNLSEKFAEGAGQFGGLLISLSQLSSLDFTSFAGLLNSVTVLGAVFKQSTELYKTFQTILAANTAATGSNTAAKLTEQAASLALVTAKKLEAAFSKGGSWLNNFGDIVSKKLKLPAGLGGKFGNVIKSFGGKLTGVSTKLGGFGSTLTTVMKTGKSFDIAKLLAGSLKLGSIGALLGSLLIKPISNWISNQLGKTEIGNTGISGFSDAQGGKYTAGAIGGTAGAAQGALIGGSIGSFIPIIGTAVGAIAGAIVGGIKGTFDAIDEQAKFESLVKVDAASKNLASSFDKLGDKFDNFNAFQKANMASDELFKSVQDSTKVITNIDTSSKVGAPTGVNAFNAGFWDTLGTMVMEIGSLGQSNLREAQASVGENVIKGQALSKSTSLVDEQALDKAIKTYQNFSSKLIDSLDETQLDTLLENINADSSLKDIGAALEGVSGDSKQAASALEQLQKALILQAQVKGAKFIDKQAEGLTGKQKSQVESFKGAFADLGEVFNETGDIEKAQKAFTKNFTTNLTNSLRTTSFRDQGSIAKVLKLDESQLGDFDKVKDAMDKAFAKGGPEAEALAEAMGKTVPEAKQMANEMFNIAGAATSAEERAKILAQALQAKVNLALIRTTKNIDALGAALGVLSKGVTGAISDFTVAAGNIEAQLNSIVSGSSDIITPQTVNPFENTANRTVEELQAGFDNIVNVISARGNETQKENLRSSIADLAPTLKFADQFPTLLKDSLSATKTEFASRGAGAAENINFEDFFKVFEEKAGEGFKALPKTIQENIKENLKAEYEQNRQKNDNKFGITGIEDLLKSDTIGKLGDVLGKLPEEIRSKAAEVTSALNTFRDTIVKGANLQAAIYEQTAQKEQKILDMRESFEERFSKFTPDRFINERQKAESRLNARIQSLVNAGGAAESSDAGAIGPINVNQPNLAEELLSRRQKLLTERDTLQEKQKNIGAATTPEEQNNLIKQLAANSKALDGTNKALDLLANDVTRLAAIESDLTKIQEARLTSRERTKVAIGKLAEAKTPQEQRKVIEEMVAPGQAAMKAQAGEKLSLKELYTLLNSSQEVKDSLKLTDQQLEQLIATAARSGFATIQDVAGRYGASDQEQMFIRNQLEAGGTVAGSTAQEKTLLSQADEIRKQSEAIIEGQVKQNIDGIVKLQETFRMQLDLTYKKLLETGDAFVALRQKLDDAIRSAGGTPSTASTTTIAGTGSAATSMPNPGIPVPITAENFGNIGNFGATTSTRAQDTVTVPTGEAGANFVLRRGQTEVSSTLGELPADTKFTDKGQQRYNKSEGDRIAALLKSADDNLKALGEKQFAEATDAIKEFTNEALNPGSIYVHDIHTEKILLDILSILSQLSGSTKTTSELSLKDLASKIDKFETLPKAESKMQEQVITKPSLKQQTQDQIQQPRTPIAQMDWSTSRRYGTLPAAQDFAEATAGISLPNPENLQPHDITQMQSLENARKAAQQAMTAPATVSPPTIATNMQNLPETFKTDIQPAESLYDKVNKIGINDYLRQKKINPLSSNPKANTLATGYAKSTGLLKNEEFNKILSEMNPQIYKNYKTGKSKTIRADVLNKATEEYKKRQETGSRANPEAPKPFLSEITPENFGQIFTGSSAERAMQAAQAIKNSQIAGTPATPAEITKNQQVIAQKTQMQGMPIDEQKILKTAQTFNDIFSNFSNQIENSTFITQLNQAAETLKSLPALTIQLETNNSKVEVILNGTQQLVDAIGQQFRNEVQNQIMKALYDQGVKGTDVSGAPVSLRT